MASSSASSSTTSFATSSDSAQPKDYAAAFATLQSAYGLGGQAPSVSSRPVSKSAVVTAKTTRFITAKDTYESAFGAPWNIFLTTTGEHVTPSWHTALPARFWQGNERRSFELLELKGQGRRLVRRLQCDVQILSFRANRNPKSHGVCHSIRVINSRMSNIVIVRKRNDSDHFGTPFSPRSLLWSTNEASWQKYVLFLLCNGHKFHFREQSSEKCSVSKTGVISSAVAMLIFWEHF
ncbi:hypothetical protein DFH09DRAFT_1069062 [Mycena vulgaris]|nr:hypothetical protein DFH09DRAFT_1069062 [Mycena vulgaris]